LRALTQPEKVIVLLIIMRELTIVVSK